MSTNKKQQRVIEHLTNFGRSDAEQLVNDNFWWAKSYNSPKTIAEAINTTC
jgi:hypothetical protein